MNSTYIEERRFFSFNISCNFVCINVLILKLFLKNNLSMFKITWISSEATQTYEILWFRLFLFQNRTQTWPNSSKSVVNFATNTRFCSWNSSFWVPIENPVFFSVRNQPICLLKKKNRFLQSVSRVFFFGWPFLLLTLVEKTRFAQKKQNKKSVESIIFGYLKKKSCYAEHAH